MKFVLNNPYRIVGILANASAREIQARKGKISAYAKVGKEITSEFDFPCFNSIERTTTLIDKAFSDIEQNQNKVFHSLFWFTNLNPVDNTAIQHLFSGNKEKAIEIWDKLTDEKEVTSKNFSAFNNIGTLYLLEESKEEIKKGITVKIKLIESDSFKDFVHTVADETFIIDKKKQIEVFIDELLTQFKYNYSTSEIIELFNNFNEKIQKYLSKKFTDEPIHKVEVQIEQCTKKRLKDKINAYKFGTELYNNTKIDLIQLKSILGNNNLQHKMLADNVVKEILQCSVDYFNESQEQGKSNDFLEEAMKLAKLAENIAVNDTTKNKVKESISSLEGMKDREINQAIEVLNSIKLAYKKAISEIDTQVTEMIMNMPRNQTINYSKVNEMKEECLDWDKVVDFITESIPLKNIEKIKKTNDSSRLNEYKKLVEFIQSKLSYSHKNKVKYLSYWLSISNPTSINPKPKEVQNPTFKPKKSYSKDEFDEVATNISVAIGILTGIVVLIFMFVEVGDVGGIIGGLVLGVIAGRIAVFVSVLPAIAIARLIYLITK
jgi:hypothetical protein